MGHAFKAFAPGFPGIGILPRINGIDIQRIFGLFHQPFQAGGFQLAGRAAGIVEIQHAVAAGCRDIHGASVRSKQGERRSIGPDERKTVEVREDARVHQVFLRLHGDGAGEEPFVCDVHGHGVVSHNLGAEIVVVDFDGYVLTNKGILARVNEIVALCALDRGRFSGQGREVFFQLGAQFGIGLLGA